MNGIRVLENIGRRSFHVVWLQLFVRHGHAGKMNRERRARSASARSLRKCIHQWIVHARIQKLSSSVNVSTYFKEGRTDLLREAIQLFLEGGGGGGVVHTSISKVTYIHMLYFPGRVWTCCPPSGSAHVD